MLPKWSERSATGKIPARPIEPRALPTRDHRVFAGAPYPSSLETVALLDDGTRLRIRPIRPDDEPRLGDLYSRLSHDTAYQRFFTVMRQLPSDWLHHFANVDYRRRLALVAEHDTPEGPRLVGVGRYEPTDEDDLAEVAFVIEDSWQGRGLGTLLLERVLAAAASRGIWRFQAYVLTDNYRMLTLFAHHTEIEERKIESGVISLRFRRRVPGASELGATG